MKNFIDCLQIEQIKKELYAIFSDYSFDLLPIYFSPSSGNLNVIDKINVFVADLDILKELLPKRKVINGRIKLMVLYKKNYFQPTNGQVTKITEMMESIKTKFNKKLDAWEQEEDELEAQYFDLINKNMAEDEAYNQVYGKVSQCY